MNSIKSEMMLMNSNKNKLNSKKNWFFNPMPNAHSIYFYGELGERV